jgi:hypothetical protein
MNFQVCPSFTLNIQGSNKLKQQHVNLHNLATSWRAFRFVTLDGSFNILQNCSISQFVTVLSSKEFRGVSIALARAKSKQHPSCPVPLFRTFDPDRDVSILLPSSFMPSVYDGAWFSGKKGKVLSNQPTI